MVVNSCDVTSGLHGSHRSHGPAVYLLIDSVVEIFGMSCTTVYADYMLPIALVVVL